MASLIKRKPSADCQLIKVDEEGMRYYVCRVDEGKVFEVKVDKQGNINPTPKYFIISPEDYKKIHQAIKEIEIPPV